MITIVDDPSGEWMGLYKDGIMVYQGHSIRTSELLRLCGIEHEIREVLTEDRYPETLAELDV